MMNDYLTPDITESELDDICNRDDIYFTAQRGHKGITKNIECWIVDYDFDNRTVDVEWYGWHGRLNREIDVPFDVFYKPDDNDSQLPLF